MSQRLKAGNVSFFENEVMAVDLVSRSSKSKKRGRGKKWVYVKTFNNHEEAKQVREGDKWSYH